MSILFENQFEVGDIISVGSYKGEVIDIGLRVTKIRGVEDASVKNSFNRNIDTISLIMIYFLHKYLFIFLLTIRRWKVE